MYSEKEEQQYNDKFQILKSNINKNLQ